ncbi:YczE/YyaS/YitT family protein [Sinomonas sp. B1-1]|uniref:membrane protein YczE n=1 Tax=Sinomonas sp. B1-1 TaxID=3141454 RepID=UPI003D2804D0
MHRPSALATAFLTSPRLAVRLVRLYAGLAGYGLAIALLLRSGLGASPWDVLGQGIALATGMSFGAATIAISAVVLVLWAPLRERPGWGTLSNAALVGVFADLGLSWVPAASGLALQSLTFAGGLVLLAAASALYLGAGLGAGPRDGLMTGLVRRTGWPVWAVRSGIELSVVALGWLLGGTVGVGTAVFAFGIGPLIQVAVRLFRVDLARPRTTAAPRPERVSGAAAR